MEELVTWLFAPIDSAREHSVDLLISWHGRLMVLAWVFITPLAVIAARFFKIMPGQAWPMELDNPTWWKIHWKGQTVVGVLSSVALVLILLEHHETQAAIYHRYLGWAIFCLLMVQLASGLLRGSKGGPTAPAPDGSFRGDHYDMTRRRRIFETLHKTVGYALLVVSMICILLGLWAANAPGWMWAGVTCWWIFLVGLSLWLQKAGKAIDTYQAIWGPGMEHPGNRMVSHGWGMTRKVNK